MKSSRREIASAESSAARLLVRGWRGRGYPRCLTELHDGFDAICCSSFACVFELCFAQLADASKASFSSHEEPLVEIPAVRPPDARSRRSHPLPCVLAAAGASPATKPRKMIHSSCIACATVVDEGLAGRRGAACVR